MSGKTKVRLPKEELQKRIDSAQKVQYLYERNKYPPIDDERGD